MTGEEDSEYAAACWNRPFISYERATSEIITIFKAACGGTESVSDRVSGKQNSTTCGRTSMDEFNK